jgi:hypothetical protein
MDYGRIYGEFIADRKAREGGLTGYVERHHIVPRALGGSDDPENIVRLTAGDHFFAHLLLAKHLGGSMWYALNAMVEGLAIGGRAADHSYATRARRHYEVAKRMFAVEHSRRMKGVFKGAAHPMYGKPCSPVALEKLKARLASGLNPMASPGARARVSAALKGRVFTDEHREKIAASRRGKRLSAETCAKMSAYRTGRKMAPETIAKVAAANRGKKRTSEQNARNSAARLGRKLSPEHAAKCAAKLANASRFRGRAHSAASKDRMAAVGRAKKAYADAHGCDFRKVTIPMMRAAGFDI